MEINEFFQTANNLMSELIQTDATLTETPDMNFCLLETDSGNIYGGISSVRIMNGRILPSCAEYSAIMAMIPTGETHITQIATMSFASRSVIPPCQDCLYLLFRVDKENKNTNIFVSKSEYVNAQGMLLSTTIEQVDPTAAAAAMNVDDAIRLPFNQVPDAAPVPTAQAASPAPAADDNTPKAEEDFINDFVPDDDNPFYEAPNPDALAQAKTLPGSPSQQAPAAPQGLNPPPTMQQPNGMNMPQGMPQQMYGQPNGQMMYGMPQGQMNPYGQPMNGYPQQNMMFRPSQQLNSAYYPQGMPPQGMQNPYGMQQPMMTGYYGTQAQYAANPQPVQPVMSQPYVSQQFRPATNSVQLGQSLTSRQLGADNEQSVFKQRLTDFLKIDGENQMDDASDEDKMEMKRQALEKKKMAKLDADFKKRQKK